MKRQEEESIPRLMGRTHRLFRHNVDLLIRDYDVYPGQPPLLLRLAREDGQSQKELASHMHVQPATLTVMIDRMAKHGLLERKADTRDQRVSRVFLTDKGRAAATGVREALERLEERSFARFSSEEREMFRELLLRIYAELEEHREQLGEEADG